MSLEALGRQAHTLAEAEDFILRFIARNLANAAGPSALDRSHGYELYLPWLIELVTNDTESRGGDRLPMPELERLYMDAAWSMCQEGFLRPGPARVSLMSGADSLGKGYSLTPTGRERIRQLSPWRELSHSG